MKLNLSPIVYTVDSDLQVRQLEDIQFAYKGHRLYNPSIPCRILAIKRHEFYVTALFQVVSDPSITGEASYQLHLYKSGEFNEPWQCSSENLIQVPKNPYKEGWFNEVTDKLGFTGELSKPFEIIWIQH